MTILDIYDNNVLQKTQDAAKQVTQMLNAMGLLVGIICLNLSDVLFGGLMMGMLLKNTDIIFGSPWDGWIFGFIISFSFWFIQILLWTRIFSNSIDDYKGVKLFSTLPALLLAVIVAIVDTNIDTAPLYVWIVDSDVLATLQSINITSNMFTRNMALDAIVVNSFVIGFYVVNMFSEVFNIWYLSTAFTKRSRRPQQQNYARPQQNYARNKSTVAPRPSKPSETIPRPVTDSTMPSMSRSLIHSNG